MLKRLADSELNLTELAAPLKMSFPAASKHVRVLEQAKLVRRRVVGRTHFCRAEREPITHAGKWLEGYRKSLESSFQKLDLLLEELKEQELASRKK